MTTHRPELRRANRAPCLVLLTAVFALCAGSAGACTDRAATPDNASSAADSSPQATTTLPHPDSLAALLDPDRPLADTAQPCLPLDSLPPEPDMNRVVHHLRNGERHACEYEPGATLTVTLVLDQDIADPGNIDSLRVTFPSGDTQTIEAGAAEPPPLGTPFLMTHDLDFDGRRELMLLAAWGATGNTAWTIWRIDPAARRLTVDIPLSDLGRPEPLAGTLCLRTRANGGMAGMIYNASVFCRVDGQLIEIYRESSDWIDNTDMFLRTARYRSSALDTLRIIWTDTLRDG